MDEYGSPLGLMVLLGLAVQGKNGSGILWDTVVRPGGEVVLGDTMRVLGAARKLGTTQEQPFLQIKSDLRILIIIMVKTPGQINATLISCISNIKKNNFWLGYWCIFYYVSSVAFVLIFLVCFLINK